MFNEGQSYLHGIAFILTVYTLHEYLVHAVFTHSDDTIQGASKTEHSPEIGILNGVISFLAGSKSRIPNLTAAFTPNISVGIPDDFLIRNAGILGVGR